MDLLNYPIDFADQGEWPTKRINSLDELPSNSLIGAHDPAIFYDEDCKTFFAYCTHNVFYTSKDMKHWERQGKIVPNMPKETIDYIGGEDLWAPDITKVNGEYRMYCSTSTFGVSRSIIFLATSDTPFGPFEYKGIVLKTDLNSNVNAIDANVAVDQKSKKQYLVYGSFWNGIHILPLNSEGFVENIETDSNGVLTNYGINIASRPEFTDHAIEGPYIIYNKETDYYYLFVSYGSLSSDYNIRIARSKNITGPYLDIDSNEITANSDYHTGHLLLGGYQFGNDTPVMGPGHNSVISINNEWFVVCHVRRKDYLHGGISTMHVYPLLWDESGWPIIVPNIYSGEKQQKVSLKDIIGMYDRIVMESRFPQQITSSFPINLKEDKTFTISLNKGTFDLIEDSKHNQILELRIGNICERYQIRPILDQYSKKQSIIMTGLQNGTTSCFMKKITLE